MTNNRIIIRHLTITGADVEPANLGFSDGVNIIYGASNTGKSFTIKTLNFMFGGNNVPPVIDERRGYDSVWLGLTLPHKIDVTLRRSMSGGGFELFQGLHSTYPGFGKSRNLGATHSTTNTDNLSRYILSAIGLDGNKLVKNGNGEQVSFTVRTLSRYMFVEEGEIISEVSPYLSGQPVNATTEKNALKLLLTGQNDNSIVPLLPQKIRKAQQTGQKELIEQMISELQESLGDPAPKREEIENQLAKLTQSLASIQSTLKDRQTLLDNLMLNRRKSFQLVMSKRDRLEEISITLKRFEELDLIYKSDIERLQAIEEGGMLLLSRAGRSCPLCGSDAEAHTLNHGDDEIELASMAAQNEIDNIIKERNDLRATVVALNDEATSLVQVLEGGSQKIVNLDDDIKKVRPLESETRKIYEERFETRDKLKVTLSIFKRIEQLSDRLQKISITVPVKRNDKLFVGIDGPTGHALAMKIQSILRDWAFPGDPMVSFDTDIQDIRLNGKERSANGKGVRAILHSASKIGVMLLCQERDLPHPGLIVLDTPLLTYRSPLRNSRYGELSEDEKALKETSLQTAFYDFIRNLKGKAQIIILENEDPPQTETDNMNVVVFTGDESDGRFGFFPIES